MRTGIVGHSREAYLVTLKLSPLGTKKGFIKDRTFIQGKAYSMPRDQVERTVPIDFAFSGFFCKRRIRLFPLYVFILPTRFSIMVSLLILNFSKLPF